MLLLRLERDAAEVAAVRRAGSRDRPADARRYAWSCEIDVSAMTMSLFEVRPIVIRSGDEARGFLASGSTSSSTYAGTFLPSSSSPGATRTARDERTQILARSPPGRSGPPRRDRGQTSMAPRARRGESARAWPDGCRAEPSPTRRTRDRALRAYTKNPYSSGAAVDRRGHPSRLGQRGSRDLVWLWWALDGLRRIGAGGPRFWLARPVSEDPGLTVGHFTPAEARSALAAAHPITSDEWREGAQLWIQFASPSPLGFDQARRSGSAAFPELSRSAAPHGAWFPRLEHGRLLLSELDEVLLRCVDESWRTVQEVLEVRIESERGGLGVDRRSYQLGAYAADRG
jgi:hypothetical protein